MQKTLAALMVCFLASGSLQAATNNITNRYTIYKKTREMLLYQTVHSQPQQENNFLLPLVSKDIEDRKATASDSGYKLTTKRDGLIYYLDLKNKTEIQADFIGLGLGIVDNRSKLTAKAPTGSLLRNRTDQIMVYGSYEKDVILNVLFVGGRGRTKSTRYIVSVPDAAYGDYKDNERLSQLLLGYHFKEQDWALQPTFTLQHMLVRTRGYTETGADGIQNLQVNPYNTRTLQGILGLSVYKVGEVVIPEVHANYYRAFSRPTVGPASQYISSGVLVPLAPFDNPRAMQNIGAGIMVPISNAKRIFANASYDFYKQTIQKRHVIAANLMWMF
jgi:outer membrane autotransporter protein